mmetsp:Transcript_17971/g.56355  ORF Transcript_17971/g.56355 Transcript_17971/m.56355 type:complete len:280 (-) Transcript_17971:136-975(-)
MLQASGELIPKGELRIAKVTEMERDGETITMQAWHRLVPFFQAQKRMRKKENQLKATSELAGFEEISAEDQERVAKMVADFHDPDVEFPPAEEKKKRQTSEGKTEEAPKKRVKKAELPEIEAESRECPKASDLKELASELVGRCRARGLDVPTDDTVARKRLGALVMQAKSGDTVDVAAVVAAADKEFGAKKTVETACEANAGLALAFEELASAYFKAGDRMRGSSYKKVSGVLAEQPAPITSGAECKSLKGVGKGSQEKIDEFLQTGKIAKLEELKNA